jgi:hypothetical protein
MLVLAANLIEIEDLGMGEASDFQLMIERFRPNGHQLCRNSCQTTDLREEAVTAQKEPAGLVPRR